jgi:hypothetical protein
MQPEAEPMRSTRSGDMRANADVLLDLAKRLRSSGFEPARLVVGGVEVDLVIRVGTSGKGPTIPLPQSQSIAEAWGGKEFAGALGGESKADEDDEDVPAVTK